MKLQVISLFTATILYSAWGAPREAAAVNPPVSIEAGFIIPLWEGGAPGFESRKDEPEKNENGTITNIHFPTLTAFLPSKEKANGIAIIVVPGGGLAKLGFQNGGVEPAQFLCERGYAAFVLKYRLPREVGLPYKIEEHLPQDGQRAVRLVRSKASEFGIDPEKVGMLGFSAGGEVVSITSYKSGAGATNAADPVDRLSGGNQQKTVLAKWLATDPDLLIVDEPTRGIDVATKAEVHRLVNQAASEGKAVLMISSELPEVLGMADRIIVMREGKQDAELSRKEATQEKIIAAATTGKRSA